jgi:hypothetical protein
MSISRAFRRQDQRPRWKAERVEQRDAALHRRAKLVDQRGEDRREDTWLLIMDKHEELHGSGFYSTGQIEEANAIVATYTPDEFDAAVALAKSRESAV